MVEKPKRKHGETKPRWKVGLWAVKFTLVTGAIQLLYMAFVLVAHEGTIFAPLLVNSLPRFLIEFGVLFALLISPFLILLWMLFGFFGRPRLNAYLIAGILLTGGWFLSLYIALGPKVDIQDTATSDGTTFLLVRLRHPDSMLFAPVGLYECDEVFLLCNRVYYSRSVQHPAQLEVDPNTGAIQLIAHDWEDTFLAFEYSVDQNE